MKEFITQIKHGSLVPHSQEDKEAISEFRKNELIRVKAYGVQKPRSLEQLKLFWALCKIVADNTENSDWNTKDKVAEQIKIELRYIDYFFKTSTGAWVIKTKSISFKALPHMQACNFFERAIEVMAKFLEVSVDELLQMGRE